MAIRRYNVNYLPPATLAIVLINVGLAVADGISGGRLLEMFCARGIDVQYGDYWRLFTCGWVHVDMMHIAFNAYGIYVLGSILERLQGMKAFLAVYMVSLLGGSGLAIAFMDPNVPLAGASGAAYGLFGAVLGFFYAKTGSIRALWEIPMARTLLIWLGLGVYMSLQPNVSLLGHLGGFVPGLILGVFFEHRYARQLDIYHKLAVALVLAGVVLLLAFASAPFTRASWWALRAMHAYEVGDLARGDEMLNEARGRKVGNDGTRALMTHMTVWRRDHSTRPGEFTRTQLRWPLINPGEKPSFRFLNEPGTKPVELEGTPADH